MAIPAAAYYGVQRLRGKLYSWGVLKGTVPPIPVISVGNVLLGGSGKTPFVIYLAELLLREGFKPAVVSRGYRGSNRRPYLVVSDGRSRGASVEPSVSGDEPYLIAMSAPSIPVVVGRERIHPVTAAGELFHCDVAVLDDGFQHLPLSRTLDIVLLNGSEDRMFPLGRLREPLSALERAHIVMLVGTDAIAGNASKHVGCAEIFHSRVEPDTLRNHQGSHPFSALKDREVFLCSAIAGPERFRVTAERLGWVINEHRVFGDHHVFTRLELMTVLKDAGDRPVVLTEKDWVKLPEWFRLKDQVFVLGVKIVVQDEEKFLGIVKRALGK